MKESRNGARALRKKTSERGSGSYQARKIGETNAKRGDPGRSLILRSRTLLGVRSTALKYLLAETEDRSGER